MKAYVGLSGFRRGSAFRPWFLKIVANEARNRKTSTQRRAALHLRLGASGHGDADAPSPENITIDGEQRAALLASVQLLSERDQLVIACRYFLELSEEETAGVLQCRRGTVKSRLSRAIGRLRRMHTDADPDRRGAQVAHE